MPIILIIALIAAGGGISYKAESALPGDLLYGVKTQIDEPALSFLAGSGAGRVAVAEDQAGTRLDEAEQLASIGLLDTATKSSLQTAFQEKSAAAAAGIQKLTASGQAAAALEQANNFRSILYNHQVALTKIYGDGSASSGLAADIGSSVAVELGRAASVHADAARLASAVGTPIGPPSAGGPIPKSASSSTSTADSISSAILTLLSKVI